jgi:hypothetical protein
MVVINSNATPRILQDVKEKWKKCPTFKFGLYLN